MKLNNRGLTLVEIVVALGVLTLVISGASAIMLYFNDKMGKASQQATLEAEDEIADRYLTRDLYLSGPSFNNMLQKDDSGNAFFDLVTDSVDKTIILNSKRQLTLNQASAAIYMIVGESRPGNRVIYDPALAYAIGDLKVGDVNVDPALTFVSLNKDGVIDVQSPYMWQAGKFVLLDTVAMIRPMTPTGPDYKVPSRSPAYIGQVSGTGSSTLTPLTLTGLFNYSHPLDGTTISSEDQFLRRIPPVGGGAAMVRISVVNVVRYILRNSGSSSTAGILDLYREVWNGTKWTDSTLVTAGLKGVQFSRGTIVNSIVEFKYIR